MREGGGGDAAGMHACERGRARHLRAAARACTGRCLRATLPVFAAAAAAVAVASASRAGATPSQPERPSRE